MTITWDDGLRQSHNVKFRQVKKHMLGWIMRLSGKAIQNINDESR